MAASCNAANLARSFDVRGAGCMQAPALVECYSGFAAAAAGASAPGTTSVLALGG